MPRAAYRVIAGCIPAPPESHEICAFFFGFAGIAAGVARFRAQKRFDRALAHSSALAPNQTDKYERDQHEKITVMYHGGCLPA